MTEHSLSRFSGWHNCSLQFSAHNWSNQRRGTNSNIAKVKRRSYQERTTLTNVSPTHMVNRLKATNKCIIPPAVTLWNSAFCHTLYWRILYGSYNKCQLLHWPVSLYNDRRECSLWDTKLTFMHHLNTSLHGVKVKCNKINFCSLQLLSLDRWGPNTV
jgi:hypothetical protein